MEFLIRKTDDELQIVYGEVYAPGIPDSQGDFMTEITVRKMAHSFLANLYGRNIDKEHNNIETGSVVVESFIARSGDPDFLAEAWVIGLHVPDIELWAEIKKGDLNGFSFQAEVKTRKAVITVELPEILEGVTSKSEGHDHKFIIDYDNDGVFLGGKTDVVDGHYHGIIRGTITEKSNDHIHRYSLSEFFTNG